MADLHTLSPRAMELAATPDGTALARHIIDYDPGEPGTSLFAAAPAAAPVLSPIPWPAQLAPRAAAPPDHGEDAPLPHADVLVVTWTTAEARALADVLTPGVFSTAWRRYTDRFHSFYEPRLDPHAPARASGCLGRYWLSEIGARTVLCFKSDLHLSQDGPALPVRDLWKQIIEQCAPKLVISTGTAGAVGQQVALGDVVITSTVRFDCQKTFKDEPFAHAIYSGGAVSATAQQQLAEQTLIPVNAARLPAGGPAPRIVLDADGHVAAHVLTTDFFAFDNGSDHYGLRAYDADARAVEMGDAVLGLVATEDLAHPPAWLIVRNASDPQIEGDATLRAQASEAAGIYERYGYWTTVGSAIACWAEVVAL
jgi:hypothetical protein